MPYERSAPARSDVTERPFKSYSSRSPLLHHHHHHSAPSAVPPAPPPPHSAYYSAFTPSGGFMNSLQPHSQPGHVTKHDAATAAAAGAMDLRPHPHSMYDMRTNYEHAAFMDMTSQMQQRIHNIKPDPHGHSFYSGDSHNSGYTSTATSDLGQDMPRDMSSIRDIRDISPAMPLAGMSAMRHNTLSSPPLRSASQPPHSERQTSTLDRRVSHDIHGGGGGGGGGGGVSASTSDPRHDAYSRTPPVNPAAQHTDTTSQCSSAPAASTGRGRTRRYSETSSSVASPPGAGGGGGAGGTGGSHLDIGDESKPPKKRTHVIPDDMKDNSYWDKRKKNNMSAKRSREARRLKEEQSAVRVVCLEEENLRLRTEVSMLKEEVNRLRFLVYSG